MVKINVSKKTRNNWMIDSGLGISALIAMISGIYFLYLPAGGFQGGRNPMYGITILFERHTWDDLHMWGGIAMITIAAVHLTLHWSWVANMAKRAWKELTGQRATMNWRGRWNLILNTIVGISFLSASLSAVYFLFFPGGGGITNTTVIFTRTAWDVIHTWSGVILTIAAVLHLAIHWSWVTKVTRSIFRSGRRSPRLAELPSNQPVL